MRRIAWLLLMVVVSAADSGCAWSDFWSSVAYGVNGAGYRREHGDDSDFRDRYEQQAQAAREYNQTPR